MLDSLIHQPTSQAKLIQSTTNSSKHRSNIKKSPMAFSIKSQIFHLMLALLITFATSARFLDESLPPLPEEDTPVSDSTFSPVGTAGGGTAGASTVSGGGSGGAASVSGGGAAGAATTSGGGAATGAVPDGAHPELTFFMHDILGGTNPSAKAITGIVTNPAVNGQVPFAKPNGAVLPTGQNNGNNGVNNNNNIPFLMGLGGVNSNVMQNNGNNNFVGGNGFPVVNGAQFSAQGTLQQLMFGTMIAIDDELTESHNLGSGMIGRAQGFYVYSSVDGKTQTMALTAMFQEGGYVDSLNFFGVHQTSVSESLIAVMGGTGKYVDAKGFALVKTLPVAQQETDGLETVLEFNVYLTE